MWLHRSRKGIMESTIVRLVMFAVVAVIIFLIVSNATLMIGSIFKGGLCLLTALISSISHSTVLDDLSFWCPQRHVTLTHTAREAEAMKKAFSELDEVYLPADKSIKSKKDQMLIAKWYGISTAEVNDEDFMVNYRMEEALAEEMRSCWIKLGKGEYELFKEFQNPIKYEEGTFTGDEGTLLSFLKGAQFWRLEENYAWRTCVICSRVQFNKDLQERIGQIGQKQQAAGKRNLAEFLRNNPAPQLQTNPKSYYEYLLDKDMPSDFFSEDMIASRLGYGVSNEPLYVVYSVTVINPLFKIGAKILELLPLWEGDSTHSIDLVFLGTLEEAQERCNDNFKNA